MPGGLERKDGTALTFVAAKLFAASITGAGACGAGEVSLAAFARSIDGASLEDCERHAHIANPASAAHTTRVMITLWLRAGGGGGLLVFFFAISQSLSEARTLRACRWTRVLTKEVYSGTSQKGNMAIPSGTFYCDAVT